MKLTGVTINNCYILKNKISDDILIESWSAKAVFSARPFVIHFFKDTDLLKDKEKIKTLKERTAVLSRISSNYIETLLETGIYENHFFIVVKAETGILLHSKLSQGMRLPYNDALVLIHDLLNALLSLEQNNVIHGFLSPFTVWIESSGKAIGKISRCYMQTLLQFYTGNHLPEKIKQLFFYLPVTAGSSYTPTLANDIYSLGVIFLYIITGLRETKEKKYTPNPAMIEKTDIPRDAKLLIMRLINKPNSFSFFEEILTEIDQLIPHEIVNERPSQIKFSHQGNSSQSQNKPAHTMKRDRKYGRDLNLETPSAYKEDPNNQGSVNRVRDALLKTSSFLSSLFNKEKRRQKKILKKSTAELKRKDKSLIAGKPGLLRKISDYFLGSRSKTENVLYNETAAAQNIENIKNKDNRIKPADTAIEKIAGKIEFRKSSHYPVNENDSEIEELEPLEETAKDIIREEEIAEKTGLSKPELVSAYETMQIHQKGSASDSIYTDNQNADMVSVNQSVKKDKMITKGKRNTHKLNEYNKAAGQHFIHNSTIENKGKDKPLSYLLTKIKGKFPKSGSKHQTKNQKYSKHNSIKNNISSSDSNKKVITNTKNSRLDNKYNWFSQFLRVIKKTANRVINFIKTKKQKK